MHGAKPHFSPTATLVAVNALAAINRMLDEKIKRLVLAHFRVKNPEKDLDHDLDALFYPDYGIAKRLKDNRLTPKNGPLQPFDYLFNEVGEAICKKVPREANLKDLVGEGTAILEFVQWWWIQELDENLPSEIRADGKLDDIFRKVNDDIINAPAKLTERLVSCGSPK